MDNRIYRISPAPKRLEDSSLNTYILRGKAEKNTDWFSVFLHFYEPVLNQKVEGFLFRYQLDNSHFDDMKQECAAFLWKSYEAYDPVSGVDFLAAVSSGMTEVLHAYIRSVGMMTLDYSPDQYRVFRRVSRLYFEKTANGCPHEEAIAAISIAEHMQKNNVRQYVQTALAWKNSVSLEDFRHRYDRNEESNLPPELIVTDEPEADVPADLPLARAEWLAVLRRNLSEAVGRLDEANRTFLSKVEGIDFAAWKNIEPMKLEDAALKFGYADSSGVIKNRRRIYDLLIRELCELHFLDAVKVRKIKPPPDYPKEKCLQYYRYQPACDGKEGLIVADLSAPFFYEGYRVLVPAESDTVLTQRYAGKLIRKLDLLRSIRKDLPEDRTFVWFFRREDDETARKRILARKPFRYTNRFAEYRLEKKETRAHGSRITFAYRAEHTGAWGRITVTEKQGKLISKTFRIQIGAEEDLSATLPCGHRICRKIAEDVNGTDLRENTGMAKIQSGEVRFVSRDRFPCNIRTKKAENAVSAESAKKAKRKKERHHHGIHAKRQRKTSLVGISKPQSFARGISRQQDRRKAPASPPNPPQRPMIGNR